MLKLNAMLTPLIALHLHYLRRIAGRELGDWRKVAG